MGNQEGRESASVASAAELWVDEEDKDSNDDNDDHTFASRSRSIQFDEDEDDENFSMPRSRSIDLPAGPQQDFEDLTDSQRDSRSISLDTQAQSDGVVRSPLDSSQRTVDEEELTSSQRTSRSNFLTDVDELNSLMAIGTTTLSQENSVKPRQEPYRGSLVLRKQRSIGSDPLRSGDDEDAVEMDGLLEGAAPVRNRKRLPRKSQTRSVCIRITMSVIVTAIFILSMIFGAMVFQKRKASSNNLRGDGSTWPMNAPSADSLFKGKQAMSNTHGLGVHIGEQQQTGCQDNKAFRHNNRAGQNCQWVAKSNTIQRCANERVLDNCRATCDPNCGGGSSLSKDGEGDDDQTSFPTESPTSFSTFSPTALGSGGDIDDPSKKGD